MLRVPRSGLLVPMTECSERIRELLDATDDPRVDRAYIRCIDGLGTLGAVVLVGVVHDHPASEFRVRRVVEHLSPDILALELPPLAINLFTIYADDTEVPPQLGGEMSTAIQATTASVVGIDAPNRLYLRRLLDRLRDSPIERRLQRFLLTDLIRSSGHALLTRLGAFLGSLSSITPVLYEPIRYDSSPFDDPASQAGHEAAHLDKRASFLRAIDAPPGIDLIDNLRETAMVERIQQLRLEGDVLVVLGMEHLDPVAEDLTT